MKAAALSLPQRGKFQGVWQIFLYNWHFYILSFLGTLIGVVGIWILPVASNLKLFFLAGVALGLFWTVSSLFVSYYVYDASPLYRFLWIPELFPSPPRFFANLHAGLDESSLMLKKFFPDAKMQAFDFY